MGALAHHRDADRARQRCEGARITPNVYTTLEEIDTFSGAMEEIAKKGVD